MHASGLAVGGALLLPALAPLGFANDPDIGDGEFKLDRLAFDEGVGCSSAPDRGL